MSEQLDPFRVKAVATEFLLSAIIIRLMQLDPGFTQRARQWFDHTFGMWSASEHAVARDPRTISRLREEYLRQLTMAENYLAIAREASVKPKSIRRRIFEWFERG